MLIDPPEIFMDSNYILADYGIFFWILRIHLLSLTEPASMAPAGSLLAVHTDTNVVRLYQIMTHFKQFLQLCI